MRLEHVVVSILLFLIVLVAALIILGKIFPTFNSGINSLISATTTG